MCRDIWRVSPTGKQQSIPFDFPGEFLRRQCTEVPSLLLSSVPLAKLIELFRLLRHAYKVSLVMKSMGKLKITSFSRYESLLTMGSNKETFDFTSGYSGVSQQLMVRYIQVLKSVMYFHYKTSPVTVGAFPVNIACQAVSSAVGIMETIDPTHKLSSPILQMYVFATICLNL